jgi:hypothetical protein
LLIDVDSGLFTSQVDPKSTRNGPNKYRRKCFKRVKGRCDSAVILIQEWQLARQKKTNTVDKSRERRIAIWQGDLSEQSAAFILEADQ